MIKLIRNNWPWFIVGAIVTSIIVCSGISIKVSPTKEEKILYYICSSNVNTSSLVNESKKATNEEIREIRINHESLVESDSSRLFGLVYDSTDIYIYPETYLERTIPLSLHYTLEELNASIPNSSGKELYRDKDKYCAIKVYDKKSKEGLFKDLVSYYINDKYEQDYYLSFSIYSVHTGKLNDSKSSNALNIVNHLLEL